MVFRWFESLKIVAILERSTKRFIIAFGILILILKNEDNTYKISGERERNFMRGTILNYWRWNPVGATPLIVSHLVLQHTKENGISWDEATNSSAIFLDSDLPLHFTFSMLRAHFISHKLQVSLQFLYSFVSN